MDGINTTTGMNIESINQSYPISQDSKSFSDVIIPDSYMAEINGCRFLIEVHFSDKSKITLRDKLIHINKNKITKEDSG